MIKEKQMNKNKKLANMAMLVALAMIFSYVESLIPINFGIPGMKLGVANLVTVTGLYFLELPEVFLVVVMRILLTGFLFGNGMSIVYSLAGGILSFLVMALMKRLKGFSVAGVSIAGGVSHNILQALHPPSCQRSHRQDGEVLLKMYCQYTYQVSFLLLPAPPVSGFGLLHILHSY